MPHYHGALKIKNITTEEKTILTVDLYNNVLTEKIGDFTGKICITRTTRTSGIPNRIVKEHTEYRPETVTNILDLSYDETIEVLAQGRCVVNKFGQWLLTINGPFDGRKSDLRFTENKITVMLIPSATPLKALGNIYVSTDAATVGPVIESLTDSTTDEKNLYIIPDASAIIFGNTLLIKGDNSSVGAYFIKGEEGAAPVKVSLIVRNTRNEITIQVPPLAEGQYWLSAIVQTEASYGLARDPRAYKLLIFLTISTGGNSEGPDGT